MIHENTPNRYLIRRGLTIENIILLFYNSEYSLLVLAKYVIIICHVIEVRKTTWKNMMQYNLLTKGMVILHNFVTSQKFT